MKIEDLIKKAKLRIRKRSTDDLDQDVEQLVKATLADLKRIGVHQSYLEDIEDPLLIEAVLVYADANFGIPENQAQLMTSYNMICTKIKGGGYHRSNCEAASKKESDGIS